MRSIGIDMDKLNQDILSIRVEGQDYLFHSPTLKLFKTDSHTLSLIKSYTHTNEDSESLPKGLSESRYQKTVTHLRNAGVLSVIAENDENLHAESYYQQVPSYKCLTLNLAHTCNLDCEYCYASQSRYLQQKEPVFMSRDTAFRALDFYLNADYNGEDQEAVDFFGGEPLLNFDVLRDAILYAEKHTLGKKRKLSFNITTNGTLLSKDRFEFLQRHNARIIVSIDGEQEIHDAHRKTRNGKGSYRRIIRNVQHCLSKRPDLLSARATITPRCVDINRIVDGLRNLGFLNYGFELMYSCIDEYSEGWNEELIDEYDYHYGRYTSNILDCIVAEEAAPRSLEYIFARLKKIRKREKSYFPCRMSRETFVVTPRGDYYPCHWVAENENFKIGTIHEDVNMEKRKQFFPALASDKEECSRCWARYLCGGGCPAISLIKNGTDKIPDPWMCRDRLITWKWMLWLYIQLLAKKPSQLLSL